MGFPPRDRAMLDALGDDEHLARAHRHCPVAHFDVNLAFEHEKKIVALGMGVPIEFALDLHDHHVVAIEF